MLRKWKAGRKKDEGLGFGLLLSFWEKSLVELTSPSVRGRRKGAGASRWDQRVGHQWP